MLVFQKLITSSSGLFICLPAASEFAEYMINIVLLFDVLARIFQVIMTAYRSLISSIN